MIFFVLKGPPPNSPNSSMKPLVDLTETSPTKNDNIDVDLEKVNSKIVVIFFIKQIQLK
jgi:hypothetical protein